MDIARANISYDNMCNTYWDLYLVAWEIKPFGGSDELMIDVWVGNSCKVTNSSAE